MFSLWLLPFLPRLIWTEFRLNSIAVVLNTTVVITCCLVLVEMKPMESHDVMTDSFAVAELCAEESAKFEEMPHEELSHEGDHIEQTHGSPVHGHEQGHELGCDVQWCTFNKSAIVDGEIISPLCIPDCEITGVCSTEASCSISEFLDEASQTYTKVTDEDTCINLGGSWGTSFLKNYLLRYNWPKAQTHLAASFVLMTMWFVRIVISHRL